MIKWLGNKLSNKWLAICVNVAAAVLNLAIMVREFRLHRYDLAFVSFGALCICSVAVWGLFTASSLYENALRNNAEAFAYWMAARAIANGKVTNGNESREATLNIASREVS